MKAHPTALGLILCHNPKLPLLDRAVIGYVWLLSRVFGADEEQMMTRLVERRLESVSAEFTS